MTGTASPVPERRLSPVRRMIIGVAAAAGLASLWWIGPMTLRAMPLFRVRRVEVTGARYLTASEVAPVLKLRPDANIFDRLEPLARRVVAMPGVTKAEVHRRLLGTLVVDVVESEPIGLALDRGMLALIDPSGRVLPFDPDRAPTDVPIAVSDSAVAGVLDRLKDAEPQLFRLVQQASRDRDVVVLRTPSRRLLLRVGASAKEMEALALVWSEVERLHLSVTELDGRFEGRVVARGRRG